MGRLQMLERHCRGGGTRVVEIIRATAGLVLAGLEASLSLIRDDQGLNGVLDPARKRAMAVTQQRLNKAVAPN